MTQAATPFVALDGGAPGAAETQTITAAAGSNTLTFTSQAFGSLGICATTADNSPSDGVATFTVAGLAVTGEGAAGDVRGCRGRPRGRGGRERNRRRLRPRRHGGDRTDRRRSPDRRDEPGHRGGSVRRHDVRRVRGDGSVGAVGRRERARVAHRRVGARKEPVRVRGPEPDAHRDEARAGVAVARARERRLPGLAGEDPLDRAQRQRVALGARRSGRPACGCRTPSRSGSRTEVPTPGRLCDAAR